ncbi:hypothetical protein QF032_001383 [Streptomyces achromogenes]|uniref:hypothetical protein n=1 Tax=Streptomyces achromogenes TaxID=67255 RepID=UPI00278A5A8C|nr:hypothetical protein [Streptomyces achromogenes]MDQ0829539.1 hypothetical protein [Streptomyces achromogenes]
MATPQRPPMPQIEPQECRARAEETLLDGARADESRALAWALLAVAGELHEIRRQRGRR